MKFKYRYSGEEDAELDVASFMNLMIVLVPVLLLSMTFTQVTVMDIRLPELTGGIYNSDSSQSQLDVHVTDEGFKVFYPSNVMLQDIPKITKAVEGAEEERVHDFFQLLNVIKEVKKKLPEKRDVTITLDPGVDYQTLISTMQHVKSYKTVVAASVVEIELFPEVSLGDAQRRK